MWRMVLVLVLVSSVAYGEITISQYRNIKEKGWQSARWFETYVAGMGHGFMAMNAVLELDKQKPVYCEPRNLALQAANYLMILDEELAIASLSERAPISLPLLFGLIRTFPCK